MTSKLRVENFQWRCAEEPIESAPIHYSKLPKEISVAFELSDIDIEYLLQNFYQENPMFAELHYRKDDPIYNEGRKHGFEQGWNEAVVMLERKKLDEEYLRGYEDGVANNSEAFERGYGDGYQNAKEELIRRPTRKEKRVRTPREVGVHAETILAVMDKYGMEPVTCILADAYDPEIHGCWTTLNHPWYRLEWIEVPAEWRVEDLPDLPFAYYCEKGEPYLLTNKFANTMEDVVEWMNDAKVTHIYPCPKNPNTKNQ